MIDRIIKFIFRKYQEFIQSKTYDQFRDLFKGRYKKIAIGGVSFILILFCCLCGLLSNSPNKREQTTKSITENPTIINNNMDIHTQIAATIYAQLITPSPEITPTPEPTKNLFMYLYSLFPCLPQNTEIKKGKVVEVVDGDNIKVEYDNQIYSVRYIGIDSPENSGQPFSLEATNKNQDMVEGKEVVLIKDISEVDEYQRLLRYVLVDNQFVNYEMVNQGFATAYTYPPDVACSDFLSKTQNNASLALLGLWALPIVEPTEIPVVDKRAGCDDSYPTVCIPPYPPDLDCGDISFRRFKVTGSDPHGFDRDGDGVGCESG